MSWRTLAKTAVYGIVVIALSQCGIAADDAPKDIIGAAQQELQLNPNLAGAATGAARVYLLVPEQTGTASQLRAVPRDVDQSPLSVLTALFGGPNEGEQRNQLTTAIPAGTTLKSARLAAGILQVDISGPLTDLSGDGLINAIAQIVLTATEINGVQAVQLSVNGVPSQFPDGNGELQSRPLTRYDYPGIVESSQPDYPAIPTPGP